MKKKFLTALILVLALFCLCGTSVFAMDVIETNANVNLRSGPGTDYAILCTIPVGSQVYVEDNSGSSWWNVSYQNYTGWCARQYLGSYTPASASGSSGNYQVVSYSDVNMRSGPGTSYAIVMVLPAGSTVYVSSAANGWATVSYNGATGYVSTSYINGMGNTAPAPAASTGAAGTYYINPSYNVNMRAGPGTNYAIYTVVPAGSSINVVSVSNGWAFAGYGGYEGYIATSYISGLGTVSTSSGSYSSGTTWYQGNNYANVYDYNYYLANNADLVSALGTDPNAIIAHFVNFGMDEGRQAISSFNVYTYRDQHYDLYQRFGDNLRMYYLYACGLA